MCGQLQGPIQEPVGMPFQEGRNMIAAYIRGEQARESESSKGNNQAKELWGNIGNR